MRVRKVLIVEDEDFNMSYAEAVLQTINIQYDRAYSGKEAIELVKVNSYSLILLDCQMPDMDGYETARIIRELKSEHSRIPIFAVSANSTDEDRLKCEQAGMLGLLRKPLEAHEVNKIMGKYREIHNDGTSVSVKPETH